MPHKNTPEIPLRVSSRERFIAAKKRIVADYERTYAMSSEEMAYKIDNDEIVPSIEMIKWYHAYDGLKFFREMTPTTGIPGTTIETFTNAD